MFALDVASVNVRVPVGVRLVERRRDSSRRRSRWCRWSTVCTTNAVSVIELSFQVSTIRRLLPFPVIVNASPSGA